jgi:hypothetical protein
MAAGAAPAQDPNAGGGAPPEIMQAIEEIMGVVEQLGEGMQTLQQQAQQAVQAAQEAGQKVAELEQRFKVIEKTVSEPSGFDDPQAMADLMGSGGGMPPAAQPAGMPIG